MDLQYPQLQRNGRVTQLMVAGKPFLILGGELGNSSASDATELEPMFASLRQMHLNTVLVPVYWDRTEPEESTFDFALVRSAIEAARANDLRLILLWFGTWKNSMSCYAPAWVKRDTNRFPRVRLRSEEPVEIISPANEAARQADATAFAHLMRWLKAFDGEQNTVLMVQVENEIGMIPEPRDHSELSERAYEGAVPKALLSQLMAGKLGPEVTAFWQHSGSKTVGTWSDIFGADADGEEVFTAWQFAIYTEAVTAAGKQEYDLPMFANAALIRPGYKPGQYPGGGPLPHLMEIWRLGAPSLDMICPDIYFPNFGEWSRRYLRSGNPLFIPEMAASARVGANVLYAIGQLGAIGTAPFAIETTKQHQSIAECYRLLEGIAPLLLDCQRESKVICLSPDVGFDWEVADTPEHGELAGIVFEAAFDKGDTDSDGRTTTLPTLGTGKWEALAETPTGAAMILQTGDEEFIVMGMGVVITFPPAYRHGKVGIESAQEGSYKDGNTWHGNRWLNGDQTHQGRHIRFPNDNWSMQKVRLYRFA